MENPLTSTSRRTHGRRRSWRTPPRSRASRRRWCREVASTISGSTMTGDSPTSASSVSSYPGELTQQVPELGCTLHALRDAFSSIFGNLERHVGQSPAVLEGSRNCLRASSLEAPQTHAVFGSATARSCDPCCSPSAAARIRNKSRPSGNSGAGKRVVAIPRLTAAGVMVALVGGLCWPAAGPRLVQLKPAMLRRQTGLQRRTSGPLAPSLNRNG